MKPAITSILVLLFLSQAISQSPWVLDKNMVNILIGNVGEFGGSDSSFVRILNKDTVNHLLSWEIKNPHVDLKIEMFDDDLHYLNHVTTNCIEVLASFMNIAPEDDAPVGIYNIIVENLDSFNFPAIIPVYLSEYPNCDDKQDSFYINISQAEFEDYDLTFDKQEISIILDEGTGKMKYPHEELRILNGGIFPTNARWRINDESIPEIIRFSIIKNMNGYYENAYVFGVHDNCYIYDDQFIIGNSSQSFRIRSVDAVNLEDWSGFPYQFTIDLMLPDCETVLDSVVVNLLNGTTSTDDFERANISVYPNPAFNTLFIDSDTNISKIRIIDIKGQLELETSDTNIDISDLKAGVYIASIMDQNGNVVNRKFIVE